MCFNYLKQRSFQATWVKPRVKYRSRVHQLAKPHLGELKVAYVQVVGETAALTRPRRRPHPLGEDANPQFVLVDRVWDDDGAVLGLGEARLGVAHVEFGGVQDLVHQTGLFCFCLHIEGLKGEGGMGV